MTFDVEEIATRSGTSADWASGSAPILGEGELGIDLTTGEMRFGDGTTAWANLRNAGRGKTGQTTLVAGTKVVNETRVKATSIIRVALHTLGTVTAPKALAVTARSNGVSFTITSSDNTDTSVVDWELLEP